MECSRCPCAEVQGLGVTWKNRQPCKVDGQIRPFRNRGRDQRGQICTHKVFESIVLEMLQHQAVDEGRVCHGRWRGSGNFFHKLCFILQSVCGLKCSRRVSVPKKVAIFLSILAHHTKNRCVKFTFKRSGQTISKHFHALLNSALRMHAMFLVKPQPVNEDNTDPHW
ncbi:hypothetical protein ACS0TY_021994 [Phlomoides rotata]